MYNSAFITKIISLLLVLIVGGYGIFSAQKILEGPQIAIENPEKYAYIEGDTFILSGMTKNVTELYIEDVPLLLESSGYFSQEYAVPDGQYFIVLKGKSRFGKMTEKILPLWGKQEKREVNVYDFSEENTDEEREDITKEEDETEENSSLTLSS
jgi:hypothetical protein